jgi:hypothetical protein
MSILRVLIGLALLTLGRKVFWLFVSGVGFVSGMTLATLMLQEQAIWLILVIALGAGFLGALLALFVQQLAVGIAGFLAGGYLALSLVDALEWQVEGFAWLVFILGGMVCAALIGGLFDWALIILSSLTGANVIVQASHLSAPLNMLLLLVLIAAGIAFQASLLYRERKRSSAG